MAATVTQSFARTLDIDGQLVGFTTEDIRQARAHAGLSGVRGQLKADLIEAWFREGQPEYEIETAGPSNGDEVIAKLVYRKVGTSGKIGSKDYEFAITRDMVRAVRGPKRGRPSGQDLLDAVKAEVTKEMSPVHIETVKGDLHSIDNEDGKLSTRKDEAGTIQLLRQRVAELEAKLEQLTGEATESDEDEAEDSDEGDWEEDSE